MNTKLIAILPLLLFTFGALANEGHASHQEGLTDETLKTVIYQAINVGALVAGLIYFTKSGVIDFFTARRKSFQEAAEKASAARRAAEQEHLQIKIQLEKLESTAQETFAKAKGDAAAMKKAMLDEANQISQKIKTDADLTIKLELEKAKQSLRDEALKESFKLAKANLENKVTGEDQARLQDQFITNIQAGVR